MNTGTLAAVVREHGGEPVPYAPVGDDRSAIANAFERALQADIVLVAGGSSVGERDYVLETIEARGTVLFQGIAIKPGKPTIFGIADGTLVFGMPGNPTSCLSNAYLLVAPLLRTIARLPPRIDDVIHARLTSRCLHLRAGTSSILFASKAVMRCRPSKGPATSRASRKPTAISKLRRMSSAWMKGRSWR